MTTYTFAAGRFQGILNNSATTVFDAETNDPFFLSDWQTYRDTNETNTSTTLAYPLRIDAAQPNATFNGGRFYGNIPQSVSWDNFYEGGRVTGVPSPQEARFNSALIFPRNNVSLTINDAEFGIRDDLDSGYVDGIRLNQAGNCTINRARVWCGRDDFIEADGKNNMTHTINDSFFENQFLWISGSNGVIPNTFFYINNCLVHFRPWLFRSTTTPQYGSPFKVDNQTSSPKFRFNNTCLVIGPSDYTDYNRAKAALRNTIATNNCRLLVQGGNHVDRELISLYQQAGFSVLEDGSGSEATNEWLTRKAAFLQEGGVVTPPTQSLTSPVTFRVNVGTPTLTAPVLLGTEISGTNTDSTSFNATNPAYSVGDGVLVFVMNDGGADRVGTPAVTVTKTDLSTETIKTEQTLLSDGNLGTSGHSISCFSFVATEAKTSGPNIVCSISGGLSTVEQFTVIVMVFDAGTFNPVTFLANKVHTFSTAGSTDLLSGAFTATKADSRVVFVAARAFDGVTTTATGWTERANTDPGALPGYAATRDALTTAAESVAAATFSDVDSRAYVGLTVAVNPKATYA